MGVSTRFIFDFDGVVADSKRMYVEAIRKALAVEGFQRGSKEIFRKLIPSIKGTVERLIPDRRESVIDKTVESTIEHTVESAYRVELNPHVMEVLKKLSHKGKVFLLSNSHSKFVDKILAKNEIRKYFTGVITLDSGYGSKEEALRSICMGVDPGEVYYVGDTITDAELAKKVGCKSVSFLGKSSWDYEKRDKIKEIGVDYVVYDLIEIFSFICSTPASSFFSST